MTEDSIKPANSSAPVSGLWRAPETEQGSGIGDPLITPGAALSRREWMKLMGASLALAGLTGCEGLEPEEIVPYVQAPKKGEQGQPRHYATASLLNGYARGVIATSYMGRPVKLEGNPRHPASLGATDIFAQASILELWDPDRSASIRHRNVPSNRDAFVQALHARRPRWEEASSGSLRVLTETLTSPTLIAQLETLEQAYPGFRWHQYQPIQDDAGLAGARLAFGQTLQPRWHFGTAKVVLALDCDFLGPGEQQISAARAFMQVRRGGERRESMNRLYALEPSPTLTGAAADHRLARSPRAIHNWLYALAHRLGAELPAPSLPPEDQHWVQAVAGDLEANTGRSLIVVGRAQPPAVHALAHWLNERLGNTGHTVSYQAPAAPQTEGQVDSLQALAADMQAGRVDTLLVLGGNPVYTAPADLAFAEALRKVPVSIHLGLYADETSARCQWHLPLAHELERWGDARGHDGSVSLLQPLIEPLHGGHSPHDLLALLAGESAVDPYERVREHWRGEWRDAADFDARWREALLQGVIQATAYDPVRPTVQPDLPGRIAPPPEASDTLSLAFQPDPTVWDGRFANNAWLQELPKPMTQLTWDNALLISPALAESRGLRNGDRVEVEAGRRVLEVAVWITPGQAEQVVSLSLGYGRSRAGQVGNGKGFNAYQLRDSATPWYAEAVKLRQRPGRYPLATTQTHHDMHDRAPVRRATLSAYRDHPEDIVEQKEHHPSLYPEWEYPGHAWGMFINLNTCIGCGACTIACQAENNIPVVGKEEVRRSREMHWIRVDRYHAGSADQPDTFFQPVPCMHCEQAPCELVCPVSATVHDDEGLNLQVYNRCIGTRFCSNNCPYKVRRFNFLEYVDRDSPELAARRNPEVTVRQRGIMEKCTYCIQRIEGGRIRAGLEERELQDGDIVTACQQVCPTEAIVFGDINAPDSRVSRAKASPLDYSLLGELNTRPRTTYGTVLTNPNPALSGDGEA